MLTSGSTGRPKVVPTTHEEIVYGLYSMLSATKNPISKEGATSPAYLMPLTRDDVVSGDLPLDHGAGINMMFLSLCVGSKFVVMPSYDVEMFWRTASRYRVSFSFSSTTFGYSLFKKLEQLIDEEECEKLDLSSLKLIGCCGAKMAFVDLVQKVRSHKSFAHIHVVQAYGCTELGFISVGLASECHDSELLNSVGFLFPGVTAKVVKHNREEDDEEDAQSPLELPLGAGERGELLVWSRSLFKRYISTNSRAEAERIFAACHDSRGEFYRTGDQAHADEEGRIYLHGRFKDTLVLMTDWKVMPSELEAVLNEHPLIETSVVVGTPDPETPGCHAPKAFVKLISLEAAAALEQQADLAPLVAKMIACNGDDLEPLARHIYDFFAARTAPLKHLRGGVRILSDFPRVGLLRKIDRKALLLLD